MNARTYRLDLTVEGHQVEEGLHALLNALLLHRSSGKFNYKTGARYSIGTIGVEDVDCERINFTYVRMTSQILQHRLKHELGLFCEALRAKEAASFNEPVTGVVELQFYHRKRSAWPFSPECIPWEVWSITVTIISLSNEHERQQFSEKLSEHLCAKMLTITEAMNNHEQFVPKVPAPTELDTIYDTSLPDVQPFLFKIVHHTTDDPENPATVGAAMKKIFKGTLSLS